MSETRRHAPPSRGIVIAGLLAVAGLVLGFGGWAGFARIDSAVVAQGRFGSDDNRKPVQHPAGGVVADILVREGQAVTAGEVVVRLDAGPLAAELAIAESQMLELLARRARLEAERDATTTLNFDRRLALRAGVEADTRNLMLGQRRLFSTGLKALQQEVAQIRKRQAQAQEHLVGLRLQTEAIDTQRQLILDELDSQQTLLDRGLTQARSVMSLRREVARLDEEAGKLVSQRADAQGLITSLDLEIGKRQTKRREAAILQLRDIEQRIIELQQRGKALRQEIAALDIRAPASGTVFGLSLATPQEVVRPAQPLMYVIPSGYNGLVTAHLDPLHADEVHPGQAVRLSVLAFDARTSTDITGTVRTVSADVFTEGDTRHAFYRITVDPDLTGTGLSLEDLRPGLPVDVYIVTGQRAPVVYLTDPLTRYFRRAFRES